MQHLVAATCWQKECHLKAGSRALVVFTGQCPATVWISFKSDWHADFKQLQLPATVAFCDSQH
jgi:hypothetical protein